ncbi:hypothetical protein O181_035239 [Austropuccinia psidii MF-1]|uniref:Retrotransposon gag domain-containing protein n=1 Tax=Austropuccinia psidii MF-1 TaxID=1389203 RepID=A0A9Q3D2C8_9BASI|nr:hypothetical protein [Austropuccinia psidii MF-1]
MLIQHSPPARKTLSQARAQAILTPTPRAPLDGTPAVPQLRTHFGRKEEGQEDQVLFQEYFICGSIKTTSLQDSIFEGRRMLLLDSTLQSQKLYSVLSINFSSQSGNFSQDRKKFLYSTLFLIGRDSRWIEPYLSNLTNQEPCYLLNSWNFFESHLFILFEDLNEVRKFEAELDFLRIKEGVHVSLYIADFRSSVSRIGDWGERALIHNFRLGLPSRILDQLASYPSRIYHLQDSMDIILQLDTRYHERQKEKRNHQEKKPEASKSYFSHHQRFSSLNQNKKRNFKNRNKPHSSFLNKDFNLIKSEK